MKYSKVNQKLDMNDELHNIISLRVTYGQQDHVMKNKSLKSSVDLSQINILDLDALDSCFVLV